MTYKKDKMSGLKSTLKRCRIGELLVGKGMITPQELRGALSMQKRCQKPLGQILVAQMLVSRRELTFLLCKQTAIRSVLVLLIFAVSMTSGFGKRAQAGDGDIQITPISAPVNVSADFSKVSAYPALYGMDEKRSTNLQPFVKWTSMLDRFEGQLQNDVFSADLADWEARLEPYRGSSIKNMAEHVNALMNKVRYISDSKNWGLNDYWATPAEFVKRGGDCEDFAIAKYAILRTLGVPEDRMRIAIVQDTQKNIPHAVLVVYAEEGAVILDNQIKTLVSVDTAHSGRYRPIYSINRQAWWIHTTPEPALEGTRVASAR